MTVRRIKIISNPISGWGRARRLANALKLRMQARGVEVELCETRRKGDAREFARAVEGYDRIICVGGDGTLSEVVNGLPVEGAPPLGAIPSGTGNAYAKELGLPGGIGVLADLIERGRVLRWDVGINRTLDEKFLMFAGAGFQAEVIRLFQTHRTGTVLITDYIRWGLAAAAKSPWPEVTVEVDGRIVERRSPWVEVFNISHYGGPLRIATHASPTDGLFDVMVFRGRGLRDIGRLLVAAFTTYVMRFPYRLPEMRFLAGRRVRLFSESPVPLHMDGDYHGSLPADLEILPHKVAILGP